MKTFDKIALKFERYYNGRNLIDLRGYYDSKIGEELIKPPLPGCKASARVTLEIGDTCFLMGLFENSGGIERYEKEKLSRGYYNCGDCGCYVYGYVHRLKDLGLLKKDLPKFSVETPRTNEQNNLIELAFYDFLKYVDILEITNGEIHAYMHYGEFGSFENFQEFLHTLMGKNDIWKPKYRENGITGEKYIVGYDLTLKGEDCVDKFIDAVVELYEKNLNALLESEEDALGDE